MKNTILSLLVLWIFNACSAPVDSTPSWCNVEAEALLGVWGNTREHQGETYNMSLEVLETDTPCLFSYTYQNHRDRDGLLYYESTGEILVTTAERRGDVVNMLIESRRRGVKAIDHHGDPITDSSGTLYDTTPAKIWDDALSMWDTQFTRK